MRKKSQGGELFSRLRNLRLAHGLSQAELAQRVGLTRQAVIDIENAKYAPNTAAALRLARELSCTVEELFSLVEEPVQKSVRVWGTASGPARLAIASVRGHLVGHPLPPCTRAYEGFSSADGVQASPKAGADILVPVEQFERTAIVMGCDPCLGMLATHLARREPGMRLVCIPSGSGAALEAVEAGAAHLAGSHLPDDGAGCNIGPAKAALRKTGGVVVTLSSWEQGWMLAAGNPLKIHSVQHLTRRGVRLVNREPGSGSRVFLDRELVAARIPASKVAGYKSEADSHFTVARAIAGGAADAGIGLRAVAEMYGLDFVPLTQVRFDLVIPQDHLRLPAVITLLDLMNGRSFRSDLASLPGYEVGQTGRVIAEIAMRA